MILSLENHCSKEQQEVMAKYLVSILGEKLLRAPLDHLTTGDLPSPNVRTESGKSEAKSVLFQSYIDSVCMYKSSSPVMAKQNKEKVRSFGGH